MMKFKKYILTLLLAILTMSTYGQSFYNRYGSIIGRYESGKVYDSRGAYQGRQLADRFYNGSGTYVGRYSNGRYYDKQGSYIGYVKDDKFYSGSGVFMGEMKNDQVYDRYGYPMGRCRGILIHIVGAVYFYHLFEL